jgi:hypothetical protein
MIPAEEVFSSQDLLDIEDMKNEAKRAFAHLPFLNYGSIIAGGAFASWYHGESPRDIDVFILNTPGVDDFYRDWIQRLVTNGYVVSDHGSMHYDKNPNLHVRKLLSATIAGQNYQFIFSKHKTRKELIEGFDYVHTKVSYDMMDEKIYLSKDTLDAINTKTLISTGKQSISQKRRQKFFDRGWKDETVVSSPYGSVIINSTGTITGVTVINSGSSYTGPSIGKVAHTHDPLTHPKTFYDIVKQSIENQIVSQSHVYDVLGIKVSKEELENAEKEKIQKLIDHLKTEETIKQLKNDEMTTARPSWFDEFKKKISRPWDT